MAWKEWLGLKLSPDEFAGLMVKRLAQAGAGAFRYDAQTNELTSAPGQAAQAIFLGRVHAEYNKAGRSHRKQVVSRFLSGILPSDDNSIPSSYEAAQPRLLPLVRDSVDASMAALMARRLDAGTATPRKPLAARDWVGSLQAGIAFDAPHSIHRLPQQQLDDWRVSFDDALAQALDNLRRQTPPNGWSKLDDDVWQGDWGDAYASSRLLTPEVIHRLGLAEPLVMVPCPEFILVADARKPNAHAALGTWAREAVGKGKRQLCADVFRVDDQGVRLAPTTETSLLNLRTEMAAAAYAEQKTLLDAHHEQADIPIFVGTFKVIQPPGATLYTSLGIWTETVDTYLPDTDLIVLQELDETKQQPRRSLIVPAEHVHQLAASLLTVVPELAPRRFLTQGFPDEATWRQLAAFSVTIE